MRTITCAMCKSALGDLAAGTRIRRDAIHLCGACGKLVVAEAFRNKRDSENPLDSWMDAFVNIMGKK